MSKTINNVTTKVCPTIPVRGVVMFPGVTTSIEISRKASIKALRTAIEEKSQLFLVTQRDISNISPSPNTTDLYDVGVTAEIVSAIKLANGNFQLIAAGLERARVVNIAEENDHFRAEVLIESSDTQYDADELSKNMRLLMLTLERYLKYYNSSSKELLDSIKDIKDASLFTDVAASSFLIKYPEKQAVLETFDVMRRITNLIITFEREMEVIELEGAIHSKVKHRLSKAQREAYLREQLKAIEFELGYGDSDDDFESRITSAKLPKDIEKRLLTENAKLSKMSFGSPEATVIRNYIETCLELPLAKRTKDRSDLVVAERILNADHDGLAKVKERILEFMAVRQLTNLNGQVLCLVGPPGVGKTSIAKSIARATKRKYVRIALGGVRDEAEIRGHRKTYIGSMPGRLVNALKIAGTSNPVILLDEVDKLTRNIQGDPTSALLEVLDMDQNKSFRDHFLEFPIDLSECIFIATANTTETIPLPLLDRMELIFMDSYSTTEKASIAKNHLIPKQMKRHGLKKVNIKFTDEAIVEMIERFTKESGVRSLEREISTVCRKVAKKIVLGDTSKTIITPDELTKLLGAKRFLADKIYSNDEVGIVNGLAWTQLGGDMLRIEAISMAGTGRLELTGHLGDIMKESARAAVSYIRKHAAELCINPEFYNKLDIHIHVPEGAIPKDGPSAGITIATAIVSELTKRTVKQSIAMTGEITLTGRVLPIGGLKEKTMAASKAGVTTVIIPKENLNDISEFDEELRNSVEFIGVENIGEVLNLALN